MEVVAKVRKLTVEKEASVAEEVVAKVRKVTEEKEALVAEVVA